MFSSCSCLRRWALLGALTALCGSLLAAEQPHSAQPTINVLATVRDKQGRLVNNLSQNDFILNEDGQRQTVNFFSRASDSPLTFGLLVDTSPGQHRALDQERSASGGFVDQVLREDKDKVFLMHFDREVELLQDLTSSRQKLKNRLGELQARAPSNQDRGGYPRGGGYPGDGGGRAQQQSPRNVLYDSIFLASDEMLQKQQGRKAIVILSDGVDRGSKVSLERAIEAAQRADVVVYTILSARHESEQRESNWGRGSINGPWGGRGPGGVGYPPPPSRPEPREEHADGKGVLQRLSQETGGRMFEVGKKQSLDQIYKDIGEELRNQYLLGYVPNEEGGSSDYHNIRLTTRQDDLTVQTRAGYYSAAAAVR